MGYRSIFNNFTAYEWRLLGNSGTVEGTNFLGTTDNVGLSFRANNTRYAKLFTDGQFMLSRVNNSFTSSIPGGFLLALQTEFPSGGTADILQRSHGGSGQSWHNLEKANGTIASPTNVTLGQDCGRLNVYGYAGGAFRPMSSIRTLVDNTAGNTVSATSLPSEIRFNTTSNNTVATSTKAVIKANGFFGAGTLTPNSTIQNSGSQSFNPIVITANFIANDSTSYIICNNGATNITITLQNPTTIIGRVINISRAPGSTGTITVTNAGTPSIQAQAGTLGATTSITAFGANNFWIVRFIAVNIGGVNSYLRV